MKIKIALLVFLIMGIAISGCVSSGAPFDANLESFSPESYTPSDNLDYQNNNRQTKQNPDGSITLFTLGNVQVRIIPMKSQGTTRGAPDHTPAEFSAMTSQLTERIGDDPLDYDACIMLAGLYIDRGSHGDAELAVKYSDMALNIRNNDPDALYTRGVAYSEMGDGASRAKAITDLKMVLQSSIQSMKGVYYVMGVIHYKDGKIKDAIAAFEKVKTIDPNFADTGEILEELYKRKG